MDLVNHLISVSIQLSSPYHIMSDCRDEDLLYRCGMKRDKSFWQFWRS